MLNRNRVLLVKRGREPLRGFWSLPGGVLEVGEALVDAVRREVAEETGLEVKPLAVVEVFERILLDEEGKPEYHYVLIDYLCRPAGGTLRAADDATEVEWVSRKDAASYRLTEGTGAVIEKAFEQRASLRYL